MEDESQDGVVEMLGWIALTAIAVMFVILATQKAVAHSWYPQACCSGYDCAPIRGSAVTRQGQDYVVTLRADEHPILNENWTGRFAAARAEPSQDAEFHVCISNFDKRILCLFVPVNG